MPHHWWLVDPENPGPRRRAKAVRAAVRDLRADVLFVGRTRKNAWFVLVFVEDDEDEDAVYEAVGGRGKLFELEGFGPRDDDDADNE
jgi:hypothetical protein